MGRNFFTVALDEKDCGEKHKEEKDTGGDEENRESLVWLFGRGWVHGSVIPIWMQVVGEGRLSKGRDGR